MKIIYFLKAILFGGLIVVAPFSSAGDLGFRYKDGRCLNSVGKEGLNPSFLGPCSDLRNVVLGRIDLDGIDFTGSQFTGADLQKSTLNKAILDFTNFESANLSGVQLSGARIHNSKFKGATLRNVSVDDVDLQQTDLSEVDFQNSNLAFVKVQNCQFTNANMAKVDLSGAELTGNDFTGADLSGAQLTDTKLSGSTLTNTKLIAAKLDKTQINQTKFENSNLHQAILKNVNGTGALFAKVDFRGAILDNVDFSKADLQNSNLTKSDLTKVILSEAKLTGALFSKKTILPFSQEQALQLGMVLSKVASVFIIWDKRGPLLDMLTKVLANQGIDITLSQKVEYEFDGSESLADYTSVLHLNSTDEKDMPVAGQLALVNFVKAGGTFVYSEGNAYEFAGGRLTMMRDLTLLDYKNDAGPGIVFVPTEAGKKSPILEGVSASVNLDTLTFSTTKLATFAKDPAILLMNSSGSDVLALRHFEKGNVIGFGLACTYTRDQCFTNPDTIRLFANSVNFGL